MSHRVRRLLKGIWAVVAMGVAASGAFAATPAVLIEDTGPTPTLAPHMGAAAKPDPVPGVTPAWQNPFMPAHPLWGAQTDPCKSTTSRSLSGPLGRKPQTLSTGIGRDCITLTFDPQGRLISSCTDLTHGPALYLLDPRTLATL